MSARTSTLGARSRCEASIPRTRLLVEYDTAEGPAAYAGCPGCRGVVHPA